MRHLRCFLEVVRSGSATAAAEALHTVQPAISRSLAELEEIVGKPLFERTSRGLVLTPTGEVFHQHAEAGMAQIETGAREAANLHRERSISIGMFPNVTRTLMPIAIQRFKQHYPSIDVRLHWDMARQLSHGMRTGEIDFLLGRLSSTEDLDGVTFEYLFTEPLLFVVRADHSLATHPNPTLDDIDRYDVVLPLGGTIIRKEMDRFCLARGRAAFSSVIETVSFDFTRQMIEIDDVVACMPRSAIIQELQDRSVRALPLRGDELVSSVGLSYAVGRQLSPPGLRLVEMIREAASQQDISFPL